MRIVIFAAFAILFLGVSTLSPAEAGDGSQKTWERHLSSRDIQVLRDLAAMVKAENEKEQAPVAPQDMVQAMRTGYAEFVAGFAPPLTDVLQTAFAVDGVNGIRFTPENAAEEKALLYFHGGGYVVGSPQTGAAVAGFLARESGMICYSIDYPLAPEHPYPAAIDCGVKAYQQLLEKGVKPANIVLAGDSAGGGLALAVMLRLRDQTLPMPAGAYLLSPWTDLRHTSASHTEKKMVDIMISREFLETFASLYTRAEELGNPLISPAQADLTGLPPLLLHVGSHEVLLDDAFAIARNAARADVPAKLTIWPGYFHVFQMMHEKLGGGRKALREGASFLKEAASGLPWDE